MNESWCVVRGDSAAVLRAARLLGLAPLRFQRQDAGATWRVSLSRRYTYYGYFLVTVLMGAMTAAIFLDLSLPLKQSVRMSSQGKQLVWLLDAACMQLIAAVSVFGAKTQMRTMITVFNALEKVNHNLNKPQEPTHLVNKRKFYFIVVLIAVVALTVADYSWFIFKKRPETQTQLWVIVLYVCFYWYVWILHLREMVFIMSTLHVAYCLRAINDSLKVLLRELTMNNKLHLMSLFYKPSNRKPFKEIVNFVNSDYGKLLSDVQEATKHSETVRRLMVSHAEACSLVERLDRTHGLLLLVMLGAFLLHLVCTPYYLINYMFRDALTLHPRQGILYVALQLVWCLYHIGQLLSVIEPCHMTHVEMETTRDLVSHLLRCPASSYEPLAIELDIFFKYLTLNQTSYMAMQAITISRSLFATILGSITTYLVIIVQL